MSTVMLVSFIERVEAGTVFKRRRWPIHITFIAWMDVERVNTFLTGLENLARAFSPIDCKAGPVELFGREKNLPVNVVEDDGKLAGFHSKLLEFCSANAVLRSWRFVGSEYKPHITQYEDRKVAEGDRLTLDNISVVELSDPSTCKVLEKYEL